MLLNLFAKFIVIKAVNFLVINGMSKPSYIAKILVNFIFSAICNIYISRLCYDVSVHLSVGLSVCDGSALAHSS